MYRLFFGGGGEGVGVLNLYNCDSLCKESILGVLRSGVGMEQTDNLRVIRLLF